MALTILIAENAGSAPDTFTDKTTSVESRSVNVSNTIDQVATATFTLIDEPGTAAAPQTGMPVKITDGADVVYFWGTIETLTISIPTATTAVFYGIKCTDYSKILERHLVADSYQDLSILAIVNRIMEDHVNNPLYDPEGITFTYNMVDDDSANIEEIRFNYVTAKDALDKLALLGTGTKIYYWYVDSSRELNFIERTTATAATALTDTAPSIAIADSIKVTQTANKYRNIQYIANAKYYTAEVVDAWKADGVTKQFTTRYPLGKDISLTVGGAAVDIGEDGIVETDFQYEIGKSGIWNGTASVVGDGVNILLTYKGFYPTTATDDDATQIAARKVVEGGSGRHEAIDNAADMLGSDVSDDFMAGLLEKNGTMTTTVEYETDTAGLISGTLQETTLTRVDIDGSSISAQDFLIESVIGKDIGLGALRYTVRTVSGDDPAQWEDYFLELKNAHKQTLFDNTITLALTKPLTTALGFTLSDSESDSVHNVTSNPYEIGSARIEYSEVA